ncbi:MAG: glycosyltransferase family protein, partial [Nanoarchaeota archaeon]
MLQKMENKFKMNNLKPDSKTKITAIIQARMGASRLPNKVLLPLVGKPALWHINHRLKQCQRIDQIIIATSTNPLDDAIEEFAKKEGITCYRGSENDLLDRLYRTCEKYGVEVFVRVTADCPFVDPRLVDEMTEFYFQNQEKCDLVSNVHPPTFPDGLDLEIIPFRVLAETQFKLSNTFDREWFTAYLFEKAGYRQLNYTNNVDISKLRWTLDTPEDYEFFKAVYGELFPGKDVFL